MAQLLWSSTPEVAEDAEAWLTSVLQRAIEDSYGEEETGNAGKRVRGRSIQEDVFYSATIDRLEDSSDSQDIMPTALGVESDPLRLEVAAELSRLPDQSAFKRLFRGLLEFDLADETVSLTSKVANNFESPVIRATRDDLKIATVVTYGAGDLSGEVAGVYHLAHEIGRKYGDSLLIVSHHQQKNQVILCQCSGVEKPRLFPVYDDETVQRATEVLVAMAPESSGAGSISASLKIEKSLSVLNSGEEMRRWARETRPISEAWLTLQISSSKLLGHDLQIELFRKLAILWPRESRGEAVVPREREAVGVYEELFIHNIRLAGWLARLSVSQVGRGLAFEDLYQEGLIGLMTAIARFDPCRGAQFSTYAWWWVRQTITRAIGNLERPIRLPIHRIEKMKAFSRLLDVLVGRLCRFPLVEELAQATTKSASEVRRSLAELAIEFIDVKVTLAESQEPLENYLIDDGPLNPVELEISDRSRAEETRRHLRSVSPRQEMILRMRFGIGMRSDYTLEEVGKQFSVTRERIRQIEKKALEKLQVSAKDSGWRP
jgi:RNA polymerase sigma factor (sigma-70 family)